VRPNMYQRYNVRRGGALMCGRCAPLAAGRYGLAQFRGKVEELREEVLNALRE